jgi:integrase
MAFNTLMPKVRIDRISAIRILELIHQPPVERRQLASVGGRSEASHLLIVVARLLRWAVEHELVTADPSAGIKPPLTKVATRDRVLNDDKIVRFWHGCDALGWPFGPLFQLLLLTGQRLREVGGMRWSELDLDRRVWHLTAGDNVVALRG